VRILVLSNMFPPHAYGGYELYCRDVVRRWRRRGHEVLVLTSDHRLGGVGGPEESGIEVRRLLHLYWDDHVLLSPPPWRRVAWERANQRALDCALADFRPEVVSAWAMGAMSLGLLAHLADRGVPVVSVVCDEWPVYAPRLDAWSRVIVRHRHLGRLVRATTGLPGRLPDLDTIGPTCFASETVRRKARQFSPWSFPRSAVVPLGVDLGDFPLATEGCRPWRWRVLHVGRLDPRKGLHTVIEAFASCPEEATLELLGDGDRGYLEELRHLATRLGVAGRVRFGRCDRSELAARYAQADVVVFAPLWDEPFGLVPLEAMACGTPVVASPTGGSREFLLDGVNCVAFPSGDVPALVHALERVAGDPELRRTIVAHGLQTAARYDADRLAVELETWHRRTAASRCQPASAGCTA
jgi:glycogen(starch) synthase